MQDLYLKAEVRSFFVLKKYPK